MNVPKSWSSRSSFLKGDSCGDGSCHFKDLYKRKMNIPGEYLDWSWCFYRLKWKFIKNTFSCAMPGWTDASHPTRPKKDGEGDGDRAGESQSHSEVPKKPKGWPSKIPYSSVKFPTFCDSPCKDNVWSLIQLCLKMVFYPQATGHNTETRKTVTSTPSFLKASLRKPSTVLTSGLLQWAKSQCGFCCFSMATCLHPPTYTNMQFGPK